MLVVKTENGMLRIIMTHYWLFENDCFRSMDLVFTSYWTLNVLPLAVFRSFSSMSGLALRST
jgi:hypothetical protein